MLDLTIAILPASSRQDSRSATEFDSLAPQKVAQGNHEEDQGLGRSWASRNDVSYYPASNLLPEALSRVCHLFFHKCVADQS